jgi:hypothetical protein
LDAAYKWTVEEYILRCEQAGGDLREILVEGDLDRDLIVDALHRWGIVDVVVRDAEFIAPDVEPTPVGSSSGIKTTLVHLAEELHKVAQRRRLLATLRIVVDRDYDRPPDAGPFLLLTDGHSIECYAFDASTLARFVRLALGRAPKPKGRNHSSGQARLTVRGREIYDRIMPAAVGIGAARLVVLNLDPPAGLGNSWDRYLSTNQDCELVIDADSLVENHLTSAGRVSEVGGAVGHLPRREEEVAENPKQLVRGHDFVMLLLKLLRTPWGRKISKNLDLKSEVALSRQLLICVDVAALDGSGLFASLRAAFGPESDAIPV